MFSKLFGRKKENEAEADAPLGDWSFLGADMHSHFVPGIDDGAKTIGDSMAMLRAMKDMGYKTIITTPHVMIDFYPNTKETILSGLEKVMQAMKENNIELSIKAAAEYYIDEYFIEKLKNEPLLTIYKNEVLVEFSMLYEPPMLFDVIFQLQQAGYRPIIAHPERYVFFHKAMSRYRDMRDRGCMFQMNMLSLTGYYGKNMKAVALELMKKGMYDYCGSDAHHERHLAAMKAITLTKEYQLFREYPFLNERLCF